MTIHSISNVVYLHEKQDKETEILVPKTQPHKTQALLSVNPKIQTITYST